MKKLSSKKVLASVWRFVTTVGVMIFIVFVLLFSRLDTLVENYSRAELITAESASSLSTILSNPLNAPYKLVVYGITQLNNNPLLATRITSAIFGFLSLLLFYYLIRRIQRKRTAFLVTILLATSAWFLHIARYGTPDIMLIFTGLLCVVCGSLVMERSEQKFVTVAAICALAISLYVPGTIWLLIAALIVRRDKDIRRILQMLKPYELVLLAVLLLAFVAVPVGMAIVHKPSFVLAMFGIPLHLPTITTYLHNLAMVPLSLFVYSPLNPALSLGHLPLLDIPTSAFFVLGMYYYFKYRTLDRAKMLALLMVGAGFLIALGGDVTNAVLVPSVYVCVAGGVALLLSQWFTVFPKNPLAQTVGVTLLALVIFGSVFYNLRSYFVAWPHWQPTKAVFTQTSADLIE